MSSKCRWGAARYCLRRWGISIISAVRVGGLSAPAGLCRCILAFSGTLAAPDSSRVLFSFLSSIYLGTEGMDGTSEKDFETELNGKKQKNGRPKPPRVQCSLWPNARVLWIRQSPSIRWYGVEVLVAVLSPLRTRNQCLAAVCWRVSPRCGLSQTKQHCLHCTVCLPLVAIPDTVAPPSSLALHTSSTLSLQLYSPRCMLFYLLYLPRYLCSAIDTLPKHTAVLRSIIINHLSRNLDLRLSGFSSSRSISSSPFRFHHLSLRDRHPALRIE